MSPNRSWVCTQFLPWQLSPTIPHHNLTFIVIIIRAGREVGSEIVVLPLLRRPLELPRRPLHSLTVRLVPCQLHLTPHKSSHHTKWLFQAWSSHRMAVSGMVITQNGCFRHGHHTEWLFQAWSSHRMAVSGMIITQNCCFRHGHHTEWLILI